MALCCGKLETEVAKKTDPFLPFCPLEVRVLGCGFRVPSAITSMAVTGWSGEHKTVNPAWPGSSACWLHAQLLLPHPEADSLPLPVPPNKTMRTHRRGVCELKSAFTRMVGVGSYIGQ